MIVQSRPNRYPSDQGKTEGSGWMLTGSEIKEQEGPLSQEEGRTPWGKARPPSPRAVGLQWRKLGHHAHAPLSPPLEACCSLHFQVPGRLRIYFSNENSIQPSLSFHSLLPSLTGLHTS